MARSWKQGLIGAILGLISWFVPALLFTLLFFFQVFGFIYSNWILTLIYLIYI